jgi:ATP dependent DNA ligase domain
MGGYGRRGVSRGNITGEAAIIASSSVLAFSHAGQRWVPSTKARRVAGMSATPFRPPLNAAAPRREPGLGRHPSAYVELLGPGPTYESMPWHNPSRFRRRQPIGFIVPCGPTLVANPPAGPGWLHEVKHDGFRTLARKQGERVDVWSRYGTDFTAKFLNIAAAVAALPVEDALIDGETVAFLPGGHSDFGALRAREAAGAPPWSPSTFSASRARISANVRSRSDGKRSRAWSQGSAASILAHRSLKRGRSCSRTAASLAWRASCRSAPAADTRAGRAATGSSA